MIQKENATHRCARWLVDHFAQPERIRLKVKKKIEESKAVLELLTTLMKKVLCDKIEKVNPKHSIRSELRKKAAADKSDWTELEPD